MALYAVNSAARPDYRQPVIPTRAWPSPQDGFDYVSVIVGHDRVLYYYLSVHFKKLAGKRRHNPSGRLLSSAYSTETAFMMPSPLDNPRRHVQVFPERVGAVSVSVQPH